MNIGAAAHGEDHGRWPHTGISLQSLSDPQCLSFSPRTAPEMIPK
jgi:hypothetical protein